MQSYPFTSKVTFDEHGLPKYDRAVDSAFLRKVFAAYFSDGIFYKPTNALQVVAGSGLQVQVNPGICHIQGAMGIEPNLRTLTAEAAGTSPRIDTVVARLDLSLAVRSIELYILKGTPSSSPQRPTLTRDATIWELGLADIAVAANSSTITQSSITDTRLDTSRCGMVAQTIGSLDTSAFFAQLQQALAEHEDEAEQLIQYLQQQIDAVENDTAWMLKSQYDPQGKGEDVFAYVDAVAAGKMAKATYDPQGKSKDVFSYPAHLYKATFTVGKWSAGSQTATLTAMDGGPAVTASSVLYSGPMCEQTSVQATNEKLQDTLTIINAGNLTLGNGTLTAKIFESVTTDIEIIVQIKKG